MLEEDIPQLAKLAQEAFVDAPMHQAFSLAGFDAEELSSLFFGASTIDSYCRTCGRPTVFKFKNEKAGYNEPERKLPLVGSIVREAECTRNTGGVLGLCGEKFIAVFFKHHDEIKKIGQMPSAADIDFAMLDPALRKLLSKKHSRELGAAIGLNAHGIGVGSFVYLRRIFEDLVMSAEESASQDTSWDREAFEKSRMADRIKLLKDYLPSRLVENSALYSVLSKGIHELSEEECRAHFALLYTSILSILKEKAEEKKFDEAIKKLSALAGDLAAREEGSENVS